jgi:hypothetical protein
MVVNDRQTPTGSGPGFPEEVEISPEMIEAGLEEFFRYDPDWGPVCDPEEVVRRLYVAMVSVQRSRP